MKIAVHLRDGHNRTNIRSESFAEGAKALGHEVVLMSRGDPSPDADLVVQTAFNASAALRSAVEHRQPYLIMEASPFRTMHSLEAYSSYGYNGLAGGAYRPKAPDDLRPCPSQAPAQTVGKTLIIGQKPTDHSLRGSDHVAWIEEKLAEYPEAILRHHPLMVPTEDTIEEALQNVSKLITYTSTTAVDGRFAGCEVVIDGKGSWGELSTHDASWAVFSHQELLTERAVQHILTGYEEARELAQQGLVEIPRGKLDGQAISERYHKRLVR
jgi:hypothetical protein